MIELEQRVLQSKIGRIIRRQFRGAREYME